MLKGRIVMTKEEMIQELLDYCEQDEEELMDYSEEELEEIWETREEIIQGLVMKEKIVIITVKILTKMMRNFDNILRTSLLSCVRNSTI